MSQKWGFLKMCSRKVCALGSIWRGARDGEQMVMGRLPGMTGGSGGGGGGKDMAEGVETDTPMVLRWPVLLLTSESSSVWNFTSSMGRWKKLSALLLRRLLVLKESERFSLCSWKKNKNVKWGSKEQLTIWGFKSKIILFNLWYMDTQKLFHLSTWDNRHHHGLLF